MFSNLHSVEFAERPYDDVCPLCEFPGWIMIPEEWTPVLTDKAFQYILIQKRLAPTNSLLYNLDTKRYQSYAYDDFC